MTLPYVFYFLFLKPDYLGQIDARWMGECSVKEKYL